MVRIKRRRFFVDRQVQGALIRRAVVYVLLAVVLIALISSLCIAVLEGPISGRQLAERMWARLGPAWVASILLIPVIVIDCIRLSNRFAGPMLRLRRAMKDVGDGKDVSLIRFRKGDFWYDFAEDFNRMLLERKAAELRVERNAIADEPATFDNLTSVT
jgi:hypothetical protein